LSFTEILLISFALAMDCFAVSYATSLAGKVNHPMETLRLAFFFGLFQGGMPFLGWLGGSAFQSYLAPFDHWLAFGLLAFIALHLFYEAWQGDDLPAESRALSWQGLLLLSLATSVDALAAGLSFSVLDTGIVTPVISIGIVAALMTFLGIFLGRITRSRLDRYAAVLGGLILLGIGIRILVVHIQTGV
tara:strand:+ start:26167 stop:26733 length:567 start_codon:yes stop_codon:yes gene_type:complete